MEITSKSNEKVKYIKSLNDKKFRQKYDAFYIEGVKVISELLDIYIERAIDIEFIAYSMDILKNTNGHESLLKKIDKFENIEKIQISKDIFENITDTINSQGILCVIKNKKISFENLNLDNNILILDKIQDAGNIGTIIRTANAFGIYDIICTKGTTDIYSPKTVRSTMLSIVKSNIIYTDDILNTISKLKNLNFNIISTCLDTSRKLNEETFLKKSAIVLGNEASGVSREILNVSDKKIKIEMENTVESLNVASASAIVLYEQYKRRSIK